MTTKSSSASTVLTKPAPRRHKAVQIKMRAEFDHDLIKRRIEKAGHEVFRITALSDGTGNRYGLLGGGMVIVYNTGTVVVAGKLNEKQSARLKRKLTRSH